MMLRRYHQRAESDPDAPPESGTAPDTAEDAPQADEPAGRSRARKSRKEG